MKTAQVVDPIIFCREMQGVNSAFILDLIHPEATPDHEIELRADVSFLEYKLSFSVKPGTEKQADQFFFLTVQWNKAIEMIR